jgi:hypothetical protein
MGGKSLGAVKLRFVMFNHDSKSMSHDALNIRRNSSVGVAVPEWSHNVTKPEDSPAAYAIKETSKKIITIKAQFFSYEFANKTIEIRALEPPYFGPPIPFWLWLYILWFLIILGLPVPFNVLGRVASSSVSFPNFIRLKFIGIFHVHWLWQYRVKGGPWQDFDTSQHRIYLVLKEPNGPWSQDPTKPELWPWTDALDRACSWASSATTIEEAAEKITRAVNRCPQQSYTPATLFMDFSDDKYLLGSYLGQLKSGSSFLLNCTDCANVVTTLSNLLGCNLWEGRFTNMVTRKFLTLAGDPTNLSDWVSWTWGYHEICWLSAIGVDEFIYDGCLQVDMDDNYSDNIHIAHLPVLMRFGTNGYNDYKYRLIESGSGNIEGVPRRRNVK